jgi:hypothetical protein
VDLAASEKTRLMLGFVAALRMLLDSWMRNESAEASG